MRKVIIITDQKFPHGSAGANYLQYLSLPLVENGIDVYMISFGNTRESDLDDKTGCYIYRGIKYKNVVKDLPGDTKKTVHKRRNRDILQVLSEIAPKEDDEIIFYSLDPFFLHPLCRIIAKAYPCKQTACITEWFQFSQYKFGIQWYSYVKFLGTFYCILPSFRKIVVISELLRGHFVNEKREVLLLPCLSDPYEFSTPMYQKKDTVDLIYSGMAYNKDAIIEMIAGYSMLDKEIRKKVKFHLTGLKENILRSYMDEDAKLIDELQGDLIIHPWLEYNDLIHLLSQMDFLLIARKNTRANRANFPSKIPEMMNFGIVPVVSNVGDITGFYLKDNVNSIIFDGYNRNDCKEVLTRIVGLTGEQIGDLKQEARKCSEDVFYYRKWSNKILDFFGGNQCKTRQ